jgi:mRNA-degrading endonuclease RelE of RelBE toxin-antitoxin system
MPEGKPRFDVRIMPAAERELGKLARPEQKLALEWLEYSAPYKPFEGSSRMKHMKVEVWRHKKDRLRIVFRVENKFLFVARFATRDDVTYAGLSDLQKRLDKFISDQE